MECVILFRWHSGRVGFVGGMEDDEIMVFPNRGEAVEFAEQLRFLETTPYQVVTLDEL